jgi:hypothetical protein
LKQLDHNGRFWPKVIIDEREIDGWRTSACDHLDMQHFGGADPGTTMYIPWRYEGEAEWDGTARFMELGYKGQGDDGLYYWTVDFRADGECRWSRHLTNTHWAFIESITGETRESQHAPKFWKAWHALRDLGLVYHAAMVFADNPLEDPDAEILYPLWVFNKAEKRRLDERGSHEGGLAMEAASKALRDCVSEYHLEAMKVIYESEGSDNALILNPTGWFVVAADRPSASIFGILRPRFLPNTIDGQAGWASIRDKASAWGEVLSNKKHWVDTSSSSSISSLQDVKDSRRQGFKTSRIQDQAFKLNRKRACQKMPAHVVSRMTALRQIPEFVFDESLIITFDPLQN